MTPRELRQAMKRQRAETRAHLKAMKARAKDALAHDPRVRQARRRRWLKRGIAVALLLLLLLLIRCDGPAGPAPEALKSPADAGVELKKPEVKLARRPGGKPVVPSKRVARPDFETPDRAPARWVDDFRLQVAARSPRLAACFNGTDRPGALRWTTLVSRQTGAVGNHDFETMGLSGELSQAQLDCLTDVLSSPGYRLDGVIEEGLPDRVSLVLEF